MGGSSTAIAVALLLVPLVPVLEAAAPEPVASMPVEVVVADRDRDGLSEDLEARLVDAAAGERVRVVVELEAPLADPAARFARLGDLAVSRNYLEMPFGFVAEVTREQAQALAADDLVRTVWLDGEMHVLMSTAVPSFGVTRARADFGVTGDGDGDPSTFSAADAVVCVIDTGVDAGHVDLDGGKVIGWRDFVNGRANPYDDNGHGTHVAGTVAGSGDGNVAYRGVAPGAAIVGVKVLSGSGSGSFTAVRDGIDWCRTNKDALGIDVISMSLGSSGSSDGNDFVSAAVDQAADAGILVVVAAGNAGPAKNTIGTPGAARKAVTVAAMIDTGESGFAMAYFSSRGPTLDGRTKPDVGGPGWAITAPAANSGSGYATYSGTSMATPFVSGVAALIVSGGATPAQAGAAMTGTAEDWGAAGKDVDSGFGRLRAWNAVKSALDRTGGTPPNDPQHKVLSGSVTISGVRSLYYPLHVTTAAPLAFTLLSDTNQNADLYLYEPGVSTGSRANAVASATSGTRQDTLRVATAKLGLYHVEVLGQTGFAGFTLDVSGRLDLVPPLTSVSAAGASGGGGWFTSAATITLTATDDAAGVKETKYRTSPGGAADAYASPFDLASDGVHAISFWSVDRADNVEAESSASFKVDRTPPASSLALAGPAGNAGWWRGDVAATLGGSDATSGYASSAFALDDGAVTAYAAPVPVRGDGVHGLRYRATDVAGNVEMERSATIRIDATPPASSHALDGPTGDDGWFLGPVTVALASTDATSGVAVTRYELDGGATTDYASAFAVAGDGDHAFDYRATDVAGNVEVDRSGALRIDTVPPATTIATSGPTGDDGWFRGTATATLGATDATSGVRATRFALDGEESVYDAPFPVAGDGVHRVLRWSRDVAGNVEGALEAIVRVDATPPTTAATASGPAGNDGWFRGDASVTLDATDATSGVRRTKWRLDDGLPRIGTTAPVAGDGVHVLAFGSRDVAGNDEDERSFVVRVDATDPTAVLTSGGPRFDGARAFVTNRTPFAVEAADALSGVRAARYRIGAGAWTTFAGAFTLPGSDGERTVEYLAEDVAGNVMPAASAAFFVDATSPVASVVKPARGSVWLPGVSAGPFMPAITGPAIDRALAVRGARVDVHADALDPVVAGDASGVARVDVLIDGALAASLPAAPYRWVWDTSAVALGEHVVTLRAWDRVGHSGEASVVALVIAPPAPPDLPDPGALDIPEPPDAPAAPDVPSGPAP